MSLKAIGRPSRYYHTRSKSPGQFTENNRDTTYFVTESRTHTPSTGSGANRRPCPMSSFYESTSPTISDTLLYSLIRYTMHSEAAPLSTLCISHYQAKPSQVQNPLSRRHLHLLPHPARLFRLLQVRFLSLLPLLIDIHQYLSSTFISQSPSTLFSPFLCSPI